MSFWKTALRVLGVLVGVAVLLVSLWLLNSKGFMRHVFLWLQGLGAWGYVVLVALYLPICTPFGLGYSALGFTCGALYGFRIGTLLIMLGADGGAVLAFVVIRYLFKDWFRAWLTSKRRLRLLMRAVDLNAPKFAFLSRFTPIPWGIQNTIYAVSALELWKFALLTTVGGFPDQAIIAYMGSQVAFVVIPDGSVSMGLTKWIIIALQMIACLVLAILMIVFAKRAIDQTNAEEDRRAAAETQRRVEMEMQVRDDLDDLDDEETGLVRAPPISPKELDAEGRERERQLQGEKSPAEEERASLLPVSHGSHAASSTQEKSSTEPQQPSSSIPPSPPPSSPLPQPLPPQESGVAESEDVRAHLLAEASPE